jgi:hypothetical protein
VEEGSSGASEGVDVDVLSSVVVKLVVENGVLVSVSGVLVSVSGVLVSVSGVLVTVEDSVVLIIVLELVLSVVAWLEVLSGVVNFEVEVVIFFVVVVVVPDPHAISSSVSHDSLQEFSSSSASKQQQFTSVVVLRVVDVLGVVVVGVVVPDSLLHEFLSVSHDSLQESSSLSLSSSVSLQQQLFFVEFSSFEVSSLKFVSHELNSHEAKSQNDFTTNKKRIKNISFLMSQHFESFARTGSFYRKSCKNIDTH